MGTYTKTSARSGKKAPFRSSYGKRWSKSNYSAESSYKNTGSYSRAGRSTAGKKRQYGSSWTTSRGSYSSLYKPWGRSPRRGYSKTAYTRRSSTSVGSAVPLSYVSKCSTDAKDTPRGDGYPAGYPHARLTKLTHAAIAEALKRPFKGAISWKGFTENLVYEIAGETSVIHRRIVFSTDQVWATATVPELFDDSPANADVYKTDPIVSLGHNLPQIWACRTFGGNATGRDIMYGKIKSGSMTILEDDIYRVEPKPFAHRLTRKLWNGMTAGKSYLRQKYDLLPSGQFSYPADGSLKNVYVLEFFHSGIAGLDFQVGEIIGTDVGTTSLVTRTHDGKRIKNEDTSMDGNQPQREVGGIGPGKAYLGVTSDCGLEYIPRGTNMFPTAGGGPAVKVFSDRRCYFF